MSLMIGPPIGKIGGNDVIESKMWFTSPDRKMEELRKDWTVDYGDWLVHFEGTPTSLMHDYHYPVINGHNVYWVEDVGAGTLYSESESYGTIVLRGVSQISMRGSGSREMTDDGLVLLVKIN